MASTLIHGREDAVLTDPGMTTDQARVLGNWVAAKGGNLTDIFITHGYGDHWFAAGLLAERFGARIVASPGTITQMHERISDNTPVPEFQSAIQRPVCPAHRASQIPGVLENPPAEFRELAGEREHLGPVGPPGYLAGSFDDRHLKLDRPGDAQGPHQPVRFDVAAMDAAKRRQHRDRAAPRQVVEQGLNISQAGARAIG